MLKYLLSKLAYSPMPGYLHRYQLLKLGRFAVRIHVIHSADATPFLHNHPTHYASLVLLGGVVEHVLSKDTLLVKTRRLGSLVFRRANQLHRLQEVLGKKCVTLFISWDADKTSNRWHLVRHPDVPIPAGYLDYPDGMYMTDGKFRRREGGVWYKAGESYYEAIWTDRYSIHQQIPNAQQLGQRKQA